MARLLGFLLEPSGGPSLDFREFLSCRLAEMGRSRLGEGAFCNHLGGLEDRLQSRPYLRITRTLRGQNDDVPVRIDLDQGPMVASKNDPDTDARPRPQ